jgi:hypothetical protein
MNVQEIPTVDLSEFIVELAKRHDIVYVRTGNDALAEFISRLFDDDVKPDETENLVIALRRANVIDGPTMVMLLGRYFDESRSRKI